MVAIRRRAGGDRRQAELAVTRAKAAIKNNFRTE